MLLLLDLSGTSSSRATPGRIWMGRPIYGAKCLDNIEHFFCFEKLLNIVFFLAFGPNQRLNEQPNSGLKIKDRISK